MKIVIAGAGAVGGFYGSLLLKAGFHVSYLVTKRSYPILKEKGLTINSTSGTWQVFPEVSHDPEPLFPCDLFILAVKRYNNRDVLESVKPFMGEGTVILPLQNGVDIDREIHDIIPGAKVIGGVAFIAARQEETGVINHMGAGSVSVGPLTSEDEQLVEGIVNKFKDASIPIRLSRDIRKEQWKKLCWNSVFNPLTVILNGPIDCVLDSPDAKNLSYKIFEEIKELAAKKGIILGSHIMDKYFEITQELRGFHTSMYEDFTKGRPTEIDYFNGYVCSEGKSYDLSLPVNCTIASLVKARIQWRDRRPTG